MDEVKKKAIELAVELVKPLPLQCVSSYCCGLHDERTEEQIHADAMRHNKELMQLQREQTILLARDIESYLLENNHF